MTTTQGASPARRTDPSAQAGSTGESTSRATAPSGRSSLASKLNWLRAAVLGANDGILSTAGLVMGVAGARADRTELLVAGLAGLFAGAFSMAGGEYVSVSSQRDTEMAELARTSRRLEQEPEAEFERLVAHQRERGLSEDTARAVARELTDHDALAAHAQAELGFDPDDYTNPWHAAGASCAAFSVGALVPLLVMVCSPTAMREWLTVTATVLALMLTGFLSALTGGGPRWRPMVRNVVTGALGMSITFAVGLLVGHSV